MKIRKKLLFKKIIKKQNVKSFFLSNQLDRLVITSHFNSIKTVLNAYFLQKVDFLHYEPKNRELIENSSKAPLNCSPLKCTYLGKI